MRQILIAAAVGLVAACSAEVVTTESSGHGDAGPYVLQIVAENDREIYYVTGPDDRAAAARVEHGVSTLIDVNEARLAVGETRAAIADAGPPPEQTMKIRAPGFSMSIAADDDESDNDRAVIAINAGGREVTINANGDGAHGEAHVRLSGSESDARDFINEAEDLSAETRQGMLSALGLTQ